MTQDGAAVRGRRTLVVEDDALTARLMVRLLAPLCFETATAASVVEARQKLAEWQPTCVLLDLALADGSGIDVLRYIRAAGVALPVAVISGSQQQVNTDALDTLSPDATFPKPFDPAALLQWLGGVA